MYTLLSNCFLFLFSSIHPPPLQHTYTRKIFLHLLVQPTRRTTAPKVFLTVSSVCPSVQSGLFMLLLLACLLLALQGQQNATPLPSPSPAFSLQLCVGSRVGAWFYLMTSSTYSSLGQDGLSLGLLGRNHWALLAIPTKTELLNKHTHTAINKGSSSCLSALVNTLGISTNMEYYNTRWLVNTSLALF